ncbi:hypothetical protein K505DRAFT_361649 [Melanomma pulvis-pyrius CBS 109.77]|uniref:Uncharacterized protein n=1 Tax=Melanomma pulvis-pyrius CBS 109.77 TaxID=1314802 RepID=A0A6A6XC20_9PLEO|nr:hypothetical protein K505DRAFT_361649 [Melanomma pulvis-pyrius CBS 109.77]
MERTRKIKTNEYFEYCLEVVASNEKTIKLIRDWAESAQQRAQLNLDIAEKVPPLNPTQAESLRHKFLGLVKGYQQAIDLALDHLQALKEHRKSILNGGPTHDCLNPQKYLQDNVEKLINDCHTRNCSLAYILQKTEPERYIYLEKIILDSTEQVEGSTAETGGFLRSRVASAEQTPKSFDDISGRRTIN